MAEEEPVADGGEEAEPEPELSAVEQAAKYPEVLQMITVKYNGKEKIFNANCWAVNLMDALSKVAKDDAAEAAKAALGDSKGMIETAKLALAELAAEEAAGAEQQAPAPAPAPEEGKEAPEVDPESMEARKAAAEEAAAAAEMAYATLKTQPEPSTAVDLADAKTGQLQGVNIRRKQVFANTFIATRNVYILTRIESAWSPRPRRAPPRAARHSQHTQPAHGLRRCFQSPQT